MALTDLVRNFPSNLAYAPIYRAGQLMRDDEIARGKEPFGVSHHKVLRPSDVVHLLERYPSKFGAVGVFCGTRSDGLVCLDVDRNLDQLLQKRGPLSPVKVTSTRQNAGKFFFRVPSGLRSGLKGVTNSDDGYEILWTGRQAVIAGVYPGSSDGVYPAGTYRLIGDLADVPDVPDWILAEMRSRQIEDVVEEPKGIVSNKMALAFDERTPEERKAIIYWNLSVIPHRVDQGREAAYEMWWKIGAAIHATLPTAEGLQLWEDWSRQDPRYAGDWEQGNPCAAKWKTFRSGKGSSVGLGTLMWLADQEDPERARFPDDVAALYKEIEASTQTVQVQKTKIPFTTLIQQATELSERTENPAELQHALLQLAVSAGYRDPSVLENILATHQAFEAGSQTTSAAEILDMELSFDWVIPQVLYAPSVTLVHGAGGDGKSMAELRLARHILLGEPFQVAGTRVPVGRGRVLWLNSDQPLVQLSNSLDMLDIPREARADFHVQMEWDINWRQRFVQLIQTLRPMLVVLDSLSGSQKYSSVEENKQAYAHPLYWLTRANGTLFPATAIRVIHHDTKQGGFRGHSSIRDAVDEVWGLRRPQPDELATEEYTENQRIITIEKSRSGRSGDKFILESDPNSLTFTLRDATSLQSERSTVVERVLERLRTCPARSFTRSDLVADPLVAGSEEGVKKALQRLMLRGLIQKTGSGKATTYRILSVDYMEA